MGSKTPATPKEKRTSEHVCKICDRSFLTIQALRSHQIAKHPTPVKKEEIETKNTPSARVSRRLQLKKGIDVENVEKPEVIVQPKPKTPKMQVKPAKPPLTMENLTKTEFSCPKCSKVFPVYFHAQKHIQKRHISDENEDFSSEDLKPIRKDTCTKCSKDITEDPGSHPCGKPAMSYTCLDCEESFSSIDSFNEHIAKDHGEHMESFKLSKPAGFATWLLNMETEARIKYSKLGKKRPNCHQCSYVSPKNMANVTYLCPSMYVTKELSDGIQVLYYKKHSGHETLQAQPVSKPKTYSNGEAKGEELYSKFKEIMEEIIVDAKNTDIKIMRRLYASALNMHVLLVNENEGQTISLNNNKSMTDDQISKELEVKASKRKNLNQTPSLEAKKKRADIESPKASIKPLIQSPSFNDSYKQFVDSTAKVNENHGKKTPNRKMIVKTKMGQFSPKKLSPQSDENFRMKPNILRPSRNVSESKINVEDVKYEVREQENDCNILVLKI